MSSNGSQISDLLYKLLDGKFRQVLNEIKDKNLTVQNYVRLFVACCNYCVKPESLKVIDDGLCELLVFMSGNIHEQIPKDIVPKYHQSMQHIMKNAIEKNNLKLLLCSDKFLAADYIPADCIEQNKLMRYILSAMCNFLWSNAKILSNDDIAQLFRILIKTFIKFGHIEPLLDKFCILVTDLSLERKVDDHFLLLLDRLVDEELTNDNFNKLLLLYYRIVAQFIIAKDFEALISFCQSSLSKFKCLTLHCSYPELIRLINDVILILSPNQRDTKLNIVLKCLKMLKCAETDLKSNASLCNTFCRGLDTILTNFASFIASVNKFDCSLSTMRKFIQFLAEYNKISANFSSFTATCMLTTCFVKNSQNEINSDIFDEISSCLNGNLNCLKDCKDENYINSIFRYLYNTLAAFYKMKNYHRTKDFFPIILKCFNIFSSRIPENSKVTLQKAFLVMYATLNITGDYEKSLLFIAMSIIYVNNSFNDIHYYFVSNREKITDTNLKSLYEIYESNKNYIEKNIEYKNLNVEEIVELLIMEIKMSKNRIQNADYLNNLYEQLLLFIDGNFDIILEAIYEMYSAKFSISHHLLPIFQKIHRISKSNNYLHLSLLNYLIYQMMQNELSLKTQEELKNVPKITKKFNPQSDNPDLLYLQEENGLVNSYESLKLDNYLLILNYLNQSLSLLKQFEDLSLIELNFPLKIASQYQLHGLESFQLEALHLALKIARKKKDCVGILSVIALILPLDLNCDNLIDQADKIVEDLIGKQNYDISIVKYYISKIRYLCYSDPMQCLELFEYSQEFYEKHKNGDEWDVIPASFDYLRFKFSTLPCPMNIIDHKGLTNINLYKAQRSFLDLYKESKIEVHNVLEMTEELIKSYEDIGMPREVRVNTKETTNLLHKIVVPLRCAKHFLHLAKSDIYLKSLAECQSKLIVVDYILGLTNKKTDKLHLTYKDPVSDEENVDLNEAFNELSIGVRDTMLEAPKHHRKQLSPASPSLELPAFRMPAFILHRKSCDCFYCLSVDYQLIVLGKIYMDALVNAQNDNNDLANDFFEGGLKFYEHICQRNAKRSDCVNKFKKIYAKLLLEYSSHLYRLNKKSEAKSVNLKLIKHLKNDKIQFPNLYNEALMQRLSYFMKNEKKTTPNELKTPEEENENLATTPTNRLSKITVKVDSVASDFTIKKPVRRVVTFNLSPSDKDEGKMAEIASPIFKIYSGVEKSTGKKKTKSSSRSTSKKLEESTKENVAETPASENVKERTKLLTERLKATKSATKRSSSRKNLFNNDEEEESGDLGVVRRSARNKK